MLVGFNVYICLFNQNHLCLFVYLFNKIINVQKSPFSYINFVYFCKFLLHLNSINSVCVCLLLPLNLVKTNSIGALKYVCLILWRFDCVTQVLIVNIPEVFTISKLRKVKWLTLCVGKFPSIKNDLFVSLYY